jgi:ring-1,2-phenylacetyl-CoA epoxidase subunit PaaC
MEVLALDRDTHFRYLLRFADTGLILGHRLSEWLGEAPTIEEELALSNMALDLVGQAQALYPHAARIEGGGRDADQLAYLRDGPEFNNLLLAELPNGDFAFTMARQLVYATFAHLHFGELKRSSDAELAGIAARAEKELAYHARHAGEWLVRLGDGTATSHDRAQQALDQLWMYTGEMFMLDELDGAVIASGIGTDPRDVQAGWNAAIDAVLAEATLKRPADGWMISGGRTGQHTEHLGRVLAEMQSLQRAHPGQQW